MPTVQIGVRLPQELYDWLNDKAKKENRTFSNALIASLVDAQHTMDTGKLHIGWDTMDVIIQRVKEANSPNVTVESLIRTILANWAEKVMEQEKSDCCEIKKDDYK